MTRRSDELNGHVRSGLAGCWYMVRELKKPGNIVGNGDRVRGWCLFDYFI